MTREEAIHYAECLKNNWTMNLNDMEEFYDMAIEALQAEVVRCKDCKWYDPPHIDLGDGKRTDIDEDDNPFVPLSVGTTVGGRCMNILHDYCCNHDREDPDDYERLVKFRNRMDFCSDGERREK